MYLRYILKLGSQFVPDFYDLHIFSELRSLAAVLE